MSQWSRCGEIGPGCSQIDRAAGPDPVDLILASRLPSPVVGKVSLSDVEKQGSRRLFVTKFAQVVVESIVGRGFVQSTHSDKPRGQDALEE